MFVWAAQSNGVNISAEMCMQMIAVERAKQLTSIKAMAQVIPRASDALYASVLAVEVAVDNTVLVKEFGTICDALTAHRWWATRRRTSLGMLMGRADDAQPP